MRWSVSHGLLAAALSLPFAVRMSGDAAPVTLQIQAPDTRAIHARVLDHNDWTISTLQPVGQNVFVWDGHDSAGRPVHPGTYVIEVEEGFYSWSGAVQVHP